MAEVEEGERELSYRRIHITPDRGAFADSLSQQHHHRRVHHKRRVGLWHQYQLRLAVHCLCPWSCHLCLQVHDSQWVVLRFEAWPSLPPVYCEIRHIQLFQVPDQWKATAYCGFYVLFELVLFAYAVATDLGQDKPRTQYVHGLLALYCGDSGYCGVWEYTGEDFSGQDCFHLLHIDRSHIHLIVAHLLYAVDGAVVAIVIGAFVAFFSREEVGDY